MYKQCYKHTKVSECEFCKKCSQYIDNEIDCYVQDKYPLEYVCRECYNELESLNKKEIEGKTFKYSSLNINFDNEINCILCDERNNADVQTNGCCMVYYYQGYFVNGDERKYICDDCYEKLL